MGDRQGIRRFLGSFFLRLTTGLVVISTGDVRCLFDVLGGDLVAKGTQQSFCVRLQRFTVANQGGHPCVALRVSHEPLLIVT